MILGGQVYINEWAEWRIKWSQRGIGVFSFLGIVGYIISGFARNSTLRSLSLASVMVALAFVGPFYYKNVSLAMIKRLLKEPNVIVIAALSLCNLAIEIGRPRNSSSILNGILYLLIINAYVFSDAVISKSIFGTWHRHSICCLECLQSVLAYLWGFAQWCNLIGVQC